MVKQIRSLGAASRAGLAAIAVSAVITLAACGSQLAGGQSAGGTGATRVPGGKASSGVALCKDIPNLSSVTVSRMMELRATQPGQILPRGFTMKEPLSVRHLATALCGLPKAPRGPVSCPADFGSSFRLAFAAGGRPFPLVTVQTSGCQLVTGLGPARTVPSSAVRTLGRDLGLKFPLGPASTSGGGINP